MREESDKKRQPCRLYAITPPNFAAEAFAPLLEEALEAGDIACVQLRMKSPSGISAADSEILRAAERLLPIARAHGALFLLNDRADLVKACGADGVHLGQEDMGVGEARRHVGEARAIGVSCHASRHLAMLAGEAGADYVAFGAFYETQTKETRHRPSREILSWWRETSILSSVAIGGVTPDNAAPLVRAGADFLAVCGGLWDYPEGVAASVRRFNAIFEERQERRETP